MSNQNSQSPAHAVAPGTFVTALVDGRRTLCLKVERIAREYVGHYLVPLDPLDDRRALALVYLDPETEITLAHGASFVFADHDGASTAPDVGDAFASPQGVFIKVVDDPRTQRLHAYVELATGKLRPRMERHLERFLAWSVEWP